MKMFISFADISSIIAL